MVTVTLGLDVVALATRSMPASCIGPDLLRPALLAQLYSMQTLLLSSPVSPFVFTSPQHLCPGMQSQSEAGYNKQTDSGTFNAKRPLRQQIWKCHQNRSKACTRARQSLWC